MPFLSDKREKPPASSSSRPLSTFTRNLALYTKGLFAAPHDVPADGDTVSLLDPDFGGPGTQEPRTTSIFRQGGLGSFLYRSYWGAHVYIAFLVVVVFGCEVGMVVLNRFLFMTGTWRFPYPIAMSFAQVLATHILLLASSGLTRALKRPLSWLGLNGLIAPPYALLQPSRASLANLFPLSLVFVLKILFSTVSIAYAILPKYTLFRVYVIPTSLALTWGILGTTHSISTLASTLSSVFYLRIAATQQTPPVDHLTRILAYTSTPCVAFYPILFVWTFGRAQSKLTAHENGQPPISATNPLAHRSVAEVHWYILYNLSLLSTVIMGAVLVLSGDIPHIWHNCYILDQYKLWIPTIGSFLTSFGVFVTTPLLIRATSPLTATFLIIPRSAFQLALLHGNMPVPAWVGVIGCYLCSVWYLIARRMEGLQLK